MIDSINSSADRYALGSELSRLKTVLHFPVVWCYEL